MRFIRGERPKIRNMTIAMTMAPVATPAFKNLRLTDRLMFFRLSSALFSLSPEEMSELLRLLLLILL